MSNVTRYDPFSIEPVADLFQGLLKAPVAQKKLAVS